MAADGNYIRADSTYDKECDLCLCPAYLCLGGKKLKTSSTVHDGTTLKCITKRSDCGECPLKLEGTTGRGRRLSQDTNQVARDHTQALMETEAYSRSAGDHKKIERLFGEAKLILLMSHLRLRGLSGAKDEFLPTGIVQNLKRLANPMTKPVPWSVIP